MYGLPDSAILGTAKRLAHSGHHRRRTQSMGGLEFVLELVRAVLILRRRWAKKHAKK